MHRVYDVIQDTLLIDGNVLDRILWRSVPHYSYASSAHVYPVGLYTVSAPQPVKENQGLSSHPDFPMYGENY